MLVLSLLLALTAHGASKLTLEQALKAVGCRPLSVWESGPFSESFGLSEISIELGAERFVRTDLGEPDGKLVVLRRAKQICSLPLSLTDRVRVVFGKVLLLRSSSGSSSNWRIFDYSGECKEIGEVKPAISDKFNEAMYGKLESCKN